MSSFQLGTELYISKSRLCASPLAVLSGRSLSDESGRAFCSVFNAQGKRIEPSASKNVDVLSCREPPSEIKCDPTQPIRCGIGMDLDKIPSEF
jgi:hypothetical protein